MDEYNATGHAIEGCEYQVKMKNTIKKYICKIITIAVVLSCGISILSKVNKELEKSGYRLSLWQRPSTIFAMSVIFAILIMLLLWRLGL